MIKVLIVEDSAVTRDLLTHILNSDPGITVIGTATNGLEAVEFLSRNKPDVITMDLTMPKMGGFEATRRIMETNPVPIVILTASWDPTDVSRTWRAMEAGAVHALEKPKFTGEIETDESVKDLIQTVKLMSEVKVVRRWPQNRYLSAPLPSSPAKPVLSSVRVVAIGASTGGPPVIKEILSALTPDFPVPILVVQHMAQNFTRSFVDWLNQSTPLNVKLATNGEQACSGTVFVGPDLFHMKINRHGVILLTKDVPENGLRPSVSYLFRSVAEAYGKNAMGVLLTGMGRDGAEELNVMRLKGAVTIAQDKDSSVVHGMPGEAIKMGAASFILSPQKIVEMLHTLGSGGGRK